MSDTRYPALYQVNTRVWLTQLARGLGRPATLDDVPDTELERLAASGFDWVWFLSVWQTGEAGRSVSRNHPGLRQEFEETLPDLCDEDIPGSGFAIKGYQVSESLGGDQALARLRQRLQKRGLRLMLDFVPNHTALDHPWIHENPEHYVAGTELELAKAPANYTWVKSRSGELLLAHGRDPYFPGWSDTLQLNYSNPATQGAMTSELLQVAERCDGVRCDMAMLLLPEVFQRTWGTPAQPFWREAIGKVRARHPNFCFMAEVYWDLEWTLQQEGFDYAYDKRLYDRLREGHARPVREHLRAGLDYQDKLARFLENHDEPRVAATFPEAQHKAAAVISFLAPGLRFFHQGQFEGRLKRISPHLCRAPEEAVNGALKQFYDRLLNILRRPTVRQGKWQLLECVPAWNGNDSVDAFIAYTWEHSEGSRLLIAVNYSAHQSQAYLRLPFTDLGKKRWVLRDLLGDAFYERDGNELQSKGLYLDVPHWQYHVFELRPR